MQNVVEQKKTISHTRLQNWKSTRPVPIWEGSNS